jgi:hypothetical protein
MYLVALLGSGGRNPLSSFLVAPLSLTRIDLCENWVRFCSRKQGIGMRGLPTYLDFCLGFSSRSHAQSRLDQHGEHQYPCRLHFGLVLGRIKQRNDLERHLELESSLCCFLVKSGSTKILPPHQKAHRTGPPPHRLGSFSAPAFSPTGSRSSLPMRREVFSRLHRVHSKTKGML